MSNCGVNLRFIASLLRQTCAASSKKKANLSGETVDFTVKFQPVACFLRSRIFRFKILRFEWKNTVRSGILFCSKKRQRKLRRVLDQVSPLKKWEVCPPKKSGAQTKWKAIAKGFPRIWLLAQRRRRYTVHIVFRVGEPLLDAFAGRVRKTRLFFATNCGLQFSRQGRSWKVKKLGCGRIEDGFRGVSGAKYLLKPC